MSAFERVDVVPDTHAWEQERRASIGASEVPAILGLSPHATPLDIYRGKYGAGRDIDPELAFIGHAEEVVIGRWLRKFRPELGVIRRGFMARSLEAPWLHASIDRFVVKRGTWIPVQMKTAHQYAADQWEDDVPLAVQAQIQAELFVLGAPYGWAVAFVGGRRFHLHRIDPDPAFVAEILLPQTRTFWFDHVAAGIPPEPSTSAEAVSLWPGGEGEVIADAETLRLWEDLLSAQSVERRAAERADELKLALQIQMRDAETLVGPMGDVLATWRPTPGSTYTTTRKPGRRFVLKAPKKEGART